MYEKNFPFGLNLKHSFYSVVNFRQYLIQHTDFQGLARSVDTY